MSLYCSIYGALIAVITGPVLLRLDDDAQHAQRSGARGSPAAGGKALMPKTPTRGIEFARHRHGAGQAQVVMPEPGGSGTARAGGQGRRLHAVGVVVKWRCPFVSGNLPTILTRL